MVNKPGIYMSIFSKSLPYARKKVHILRVLGIMTVRRSEYRDGWVGCIYVLVLLVYALLYQQQERQLATQAIRCRSCNLASLQQHLD